jgi:hypothetical protein
MHAPKKRVRVVRWYCRHLPVRSCSMFDRPIPALIFFFAIALIGLQSYSLMRQVACLADQNTSAYCYIEAASSPNPSDLYFYSLPFGVPLPTNTNLSCSGCTKNVMALFGSQTNQTDGLEETYKFAANLAASKCGSTYIYTQSAALASSSSSALSWIGGHPPTGWTVALALCILLMEQV